MSAVESAHHIHSCGCKSNFPLRDCGDGKCLECVAADETVSLMHVYRELMHDHDKPHADAIMRSIRNLNNALGRAIDNRLRSQAKGN